MKINNQFSADYVEIVGEKNIRDLNQFSSKIKTDVLAIMAEFACTYNNPIQKLIPKIEKASIDRNYSHFCDGYTFRLDLDAVACFLEWRFIYADGPGFREGVKTNQCQCTGQWSFQGHQDSPGSAWS